MYRYFIIFISVLLFAVFPVFAQEEMPGEGYDMAPPPPLDNDMIDWMIGEWEGWTTSPMGKAKDHMVIEYGLDKQFQLIHLESKMTETNKEAFTKMGMDEEAMNMMADMLYKGMGVMTLMPKTGEWVGYWFDNWRMVSEGKGKREGNKSVMEWTSAMGKETRTVEKMGDKLVMTFSWTDPQGQTFEGRSEYTRVKGTKTE